MWFVETCIKALVPITTWAPAWMVQDKAQHPLNLPSNDILSPQAAPCGATHCHRPEEFKCHYPKLEAQGFRSCNTPDDRECWLRNSHDPYPSLSQYDIHTNCESLGSFLT